MQRTDSDATVRGQVSGGAMALLPYVSDLALGAIENPPAAGWFELDGSLAFFDISGFTPLTERLARLGRVGAEELNDVLNVAFDGLIRCALERGGDILEFGGDAILVLFSGAGHERRAVVAAAEMQHFLADGGRIPTSLGDVRLRMSCGIAAGRQPYHLVGSTRRALVVSGPVSTAMARLESAARPGEVLVDRRIADAQPGGWVVRRRTDGQLRVRLDRIISDEARHTPERHRSGGDPQRLLPRQLRALIDGRAGGGELKQVALSFLRLDGTADLLETDGPDTVHRLLGDVTDVIDRATAELDVCWLETQADTNAVRWMVTAGAPSVTERDGERLLRVLRRIADETPTPLRIGASLGVTFVGDMGHPLRRTYIVVGDITNLAARLMTTAEPGQILATDQLLDSCVGRFEHRALAPFSVKGKRTLVRASVVGARSEESPDRGATDDSIPPMVGRDDELARLIELIRSGDAVELTGDAGVGKTRLCQEAVRREADRRWFVLRGEPHELGSPYLPYRRLLRAATGIDLNADAASAGAAIASVVAETDPEQSRWLPLIADVIGAEVPMSDDVDALDPTFRTDRLIDAVSTLLRAVLDAGSVILIEDVHWIDEASAALTQRLIDVLRGHTSVILTRRPEGWSPTSLSTIELSTIDADAADGLLLRELPAALASDATLARLRASAGGNPLYLIELARAVANGGDDADGHGGADAEYPDTVERLLAARIDELPLSGRRLIREVSVLGTTVSRALAARVMDRPELIATDVWDRELGDLIVNDEHTVRFRHDLLRVAAYQGLSRRQRRAVHRRAGDAIEQWGDAAPIADVAATLAFHATGSGMADRIVRWSGAAAEAAIERNAMETAERLLIEVAAAQRLAGAPLPERCAVQRRLAVAAERAGHPERALDALNAAARLTDDRERAAIAVDRARLLEKLGRYRPALASTTRALKACPDPAVQAHLLLARASIRNYQGRWRDCLALVRSILEDPGEDQRLVAQAHLLAEWCCDNLGLPERAEHERAALEILERVDDSVGLANLLLNRGVSAWRECRAVDAVADFRASAERYERAGDVLGAALADNNLAEVLTLQGHLDAAAALLTHARRVTLAASYPYGTLTTVSGLSRIAAWRGEHDDALRLIGEALDGFRDLGADEYVADSLVRLVEIQVLRGDANEALVTAERADTALRDLGEVPVAPATLARLRAGALLLAGRADEARASLEDALRRATGEGFVYEMALASLALARVDGDDGRAAVARAQLDDMGVVHLPPGV